MNKISTFFRFGIMIVSIFALSLKSNAQIIYTDINPDTTLTGSTSSPFHYYYMDLNHDSVIDFKFAHFFPNASFVSAEIYCQFGNNQDEEILCNNNYPMALNNAATIDQNAGTWVNTVSGSSNSALYLNGFGGSTGNWIGVIDKYVGLRIKLNGQWHYGWARMDIPASAANMIIKDYAIQGTANTAIQAGDSGSTVEVNPNTKTGDISVYSFNKNIQINIPDNNVKAEVTVFNLIAQKVYSTTLNASTSLNLDSEKTGIYMVKIINNNDIKTYKVYLK